MDDDLERFEDWMTAKEMADWLGVTPRVLSSNRIPHAEVGDRRFYHKPTVARWLHNRQRRDYPDGR